MHCSKILGALCKIDGFGLDGCAVEPHVGIFFGLPFRTDGTGDSSRGLAPSGRHDTCHETFATLISEGRPSPRTASEIRKDAAAVVTEGRGMELDVLHVMTCAPARSARAAVAASPSDL